MKRMTRILTCFFVIVFIAGCELNSNEVETRIFESKNVREISEANVEETYYYGEIFNHQTIEAESQAIETGFEPEIGVDERLALLGYYEELTESEMYLVTSFVFPIPIRGPIPPCPPNPKRDCRMPKVDIASFTLSVFCQNPELVSSSIITEGGTLAKLTNVEYDAEHQIALMSYDLVNPELSGLPSTVHTTTTVIIEGEEQEVVIEMPVAGEIFY